MKIAYPDLPLALAALMVLRGLVVEPLDPNAFVYILPRHGPLTTNQAIHPIRIWEKPAVCVSLAMTGMLAVGMWTDDFELTQEEHWREEMRRIVHRDHVGDREQARRVFVCSGSEAIPMTCDEAIRFQRLYKFPAAARGIHRLANDPFADALRLEHGATDSDTTLRFTRLLNVPPLQQL